jgi:glycosyltransferase involved in cell wall biosynthesis
LESKRYDMLTILMSSYNHAEFLHVTLASAIKLGEDVTILCTDDGSIDNSRDILIKYSKFHKNLHFIPGPTGNIGFSNRINLFRDSIKTQYLSILNSDDMLIPAGVKLGLQILKRTNHDFLTGSLGLIDAAGHSIGNLNGPFEPQISFPDVADDFLSSLRFGVIGNDAIKLLAMQNWIRSSSNLIIRSDLFWEIGGIQNYFFASDWALGLRLLYSSSGSYSKIPFVNYRTHANNTIGRNIEQSAKEVQQIFQDFLHLYPELNNDTDFQRFLALNPYLAQGD